mmetsp:Transcript_16352/g.41877  ORF Transcript_16352/g.41877 Transcript_16352/m.41877 type:complete len:205 (-) Transcript_16352:45-659(-)
MEPAARGLPGGVDAPGAEHAATVKAGDELLRVPDALKRLAHGVLASDVPQQLGLANAVRVDDAGVLVHEGVHAAPCGGVRAADAVVQRLPVVPQQRTCLAHLLRRQPAQHHIAFFVQVGLCLCVEAVEPRRRCGGDAPLRLPLLPAQPAQEAHFACCVRRSGGEVRGGARPVTTPVLASSEEETAAQKTDGRFGTRPIGTSRED